MVHSKEPLAGLRRRLRPRRQRQQPNTISSNNSYQAYHQSESPTIPSPAPNNYPFNPYHVPEVLPETSPNTPRITSPIDQNVPSKAPPTKTSQSFPSLDSKSQQEHDLQKEPVSFPSVKENPNQSDLKKIATVVPIRVNNLHINSPEQSHYHQHPRPLVHEEINNPINLPETEPQTQPEFQPTQTSPNGSSHKHFHRFLFSKLRHRKHPNDSKGINYNSSNQAKSTDDRSITSNTSSFIRRGIRGMGGVKVFLRNQRDAANGAGKLQDVPDVEHEISNSNQPFSAADDPVLITAPPPNRVTSVAPDSRIRDFIATSTGYVTDTAMTSDGQSIPHPYSQFTAKIGKDLSAGSKCNDGYIQFTVPSGWVANRTTDGFYLLKGTAIGFIRAVKAKHATMAVMNTARLQVMSQISVLTSPSFVSETEAMVKYVSHVGEGVGYVSLFIS